MNSKCDEILDLPALRRVPDRANSNALSLYAVQDNVRSASDHQLSDSRLCPNPSEVRMIS
jgi:hypothetical protein